MNRDPTIKVNQGVILYDQNRFNEAILYFKNCPTDMTSLYMLGISYYNGNGIPSNRAQAAKYFMEAAEKNHWQSIIELANMCWYSQEYEDQNFSNAMESVIWSLENKTLYDETDGYTFYDNKQFSEAINSFKTAHQNGNLKASFGLGQCYLLIDSMKNLSQAIYYFLFAANKGEASSQYIMGQFYLRGYGVTQNYIQAADWFYKAYKNGHQFAKIELEKLLIFEEVKQYIENLQQSDQKVSDQISKTTITESEGKNALTLGIVLLLCSLLLGIFTTEIPAFTGFCGFGMLVGAIATLVGLFQYCNN